MLERDSAWTKLVLTASFVRMKSPSLAPSIAERSSLLQRLLAHAQTYNSWMGKLNVDPNFSQDAMERQLALLSDAELEDLDGRFERALGLMAVSFPAIEPELQSGRRGFSKQSEIQSFKWALKKADLELADPNFYDCLEEGDIMEVFSEQGVQLYRSWSCYQYCSYSALELKLYDWDTLYQRPAWVAKTLWELMPKLFEPGAKTMAYDIPEYVMTERLHKRNRRLLFRMKYASPLVNRTTGRICAFVSTGQLSLLQDASPSPDILIL